MGAEWKLLDLGIGSLYMQRLTLHQQPRSASPKVSLRYFERAIVAKSVDTLVQ
jgi:hypothetical protein